VRIHDDDSATGLCRVLAVKCMVLGQDILFAEPRDIEGTAFVYNNKTLSFYFDTDTKVQDGMQPTVHMVFDVLSLFKGANTIDFTGNHNVHKPIDGKPLAENIETAFSFDHVHQ